MFSSTPIEAPATTQLALVQPAMGMLSPRSLGRLEARYEAAETNSDNRRLWSGADALSADGSANPHVRRILRNRVRLAYRNNAYLQGMSKTIGIEVVGTGPQLQIVEEVDTEEATEEEASWQAWCQRTNLAEKLRLVIETEDVSGEDFIMQGQTESGDFDVAVYEPDHVQGTLGRAPDKNYYDGVHYNDYGEAIAYDVLNSHPGDGAIGALNNNEYRTIPAEFIYHFYTPSRPGQRRGVSNYAAAVALFEERRRHRGAVLSAAETAATFVSVIEQDKDLVATGPGGQQTPNGPSKPMEEIELNHRVATVLPPGQKLGQIKAEQPTTAFTEFDNALLREASRSVNMPFILAALDSSGRNLASAYLDLQTWRKVVAVRRAKLNGLLDWIRRGWRRWYGYGSEPIAAGITHVWRWEELGEHADPSKNASADATNLESGATTLAEVYARKGRDWWKALVQRAKEFGVTPEVLQQRMLDAAYPAPGQVGSQLAKPKKGPKDDGDEE